MSYTSSWYVADHIIYLTMQGEISVDELQAANDAILKNLDSYHHKLGIVLDASNLKIGYQTADTLRDTLTFVEHSQLKFAFVVADNKLVRLVMLMAFASSPALVKQFEAFDDVVDYFNQRGFDTLRV